MAQTTTKMITREQAEQAGYNAAVQGWKSRKPGFNLAPSRGDRDKYTNALLWSEYLRGWTRGVNEQKAIDSKW